MALTILLTLILIGLSILVWCKWEERKWLDDREYVHLTKPKRDFIEKQLAEARAAVDDKMPDDANFFANPKYTTVSQDEFLANLAANKREYKLQKAMEAKIVKKPKKPIQ